MPNFALLAEADFLEQKKKLKVTATSVSQLEGAVASALRLPHNVTAEVYDKDFDEYVPLSELDQLEGNKGKIRLSRAPDSASASAQAASAAPASRPPVASTVAAAAAPASVPALAPDPASTTAAAKNLSTDIAQTDIIAGTGTGTGVGAGAGASAESRAAAAPTAAPANAVHVRVHMGKDLQDVQTFSAQDPYVKITLLPMGKTGGTVELDKSKFQARTNAVLGGGVCPHWDDPLEYNTKLCVPLAPGATSIAIEVWNENAVVDDVIGTTTLKLPLGSKADAGPKWLDLRPCGQLLCTAYTGEMPQCIEHVREEEVSMWSRLMG